MATWYPFSNITPADPNSLQAWDYTTLVDGDKAVGEISAGVVLPYKWDASSALTEDLPHVINPDGNAGNGRWLRIEFDTLGNIRNGSIEETFNALVTSDGATVTMSLEKSGGAGGDLTGFFSTGYATIDCTPAKTIALTAGSDIAPTENYIYILQSAPTTLVKSTTDWPSAEHIKIGFFLVPSASFVQTNGCYVNQNWNDHHQDVNGQGHLSHIGECIRLTMEGSRWHSGIAGNGSDDFIDITINGGAADDVYIKTTAGVAYQMHRHDITAKDTGVSDNILVVNDSVTPYDDITNLNTKLLDSTGASMSGKYFNIVIWMTANKSGEYSPIMVNLPSGSYNSLSSAENDVSGYDVYDIPSSFVQESSVGFLIARVTFKHAVAASGTWTVVSTTDLRGSTPGTASGGTGGGGPTFADNVFNIFNVSDITKILDFDLSGITTGNTRTVTPADADMTLLSATQYTDLTDAGATTLHKHSHTNLDDIGSNAHSVIDTHLGAANPHSGHVDTSGNETIAGEKTFSTFPITPSAAPDADYEVANMKYVDDEITSATAATKKYEKQAGSDGATSNTVFTISGFTYVQGNDTLVVYVNGQKAEEVASASDETEYEETSTSSITFGASLLDDDVVEFYIHGNYTLAAADYIPTDEKGNKNKIINGNFNIWQRGTSFDSTTTPANSDDTYLADRWILLSDGNDAVDVTKQTGGGVDGETPYIRMDVETVSKKFGILQVIENVNCQKLIGNAVSLSFEAKVSDATKLSDIRAVVLAWDSTADTVTSDVISAWGAEGVNPTLVANWTAENTAADLSVLTSWARYEIENISIDTASTTNIAVLIYENDVATNDTAGSLLEITNVQLEIGDEGTPFEDRSFQEELALCQRYYEKSYLQADAPGTTSTAAGHLRIYASGFTRHCANYLHFNTLKRAIPTMTIYSYNTGASGNVYNNTDAADRAVSSVDTTGEQHGGFITLSAGQDANDFLIFHFTAESEL
jgi:hypothetical protein